MENFFSHTSGVWARGVVFRITCSVMFVGCFFAVGLICYIIPANSNALGASLMPAG